MSDSEISSSFLDGFEADLRNDVTQLSFTVPASSGAIARIVGRSFRPTQLDSDDVVPFVDGVVDTGPFGMEYHRVASRRLVLVGDLNTTNSPVQETQVDLSTTPASTILVPFLQMAEPVSALPASSGAIRAAPNHAQLVVPASSNNPSFSGIQFHNSFEAFEEERRR